MMFKFEIIMSLDLKRAKDILNLLLVNLRYNGCEIERAVDIILCNESKDFSLEGEKFLKNIKVAKPDKDALYKLLFDEYLLSQFIETGMIKTTSAESFPSEDLGKVTSGHEADVPCKGRVYSFMSDLVTC